RGERLIHAGNEVRSVGASLLATALMMAPAVAQQNQTPGHSLGKVTTPGKLILLTLDEDVLGKAPLFNLQHRTLHFTPEGGGYRIENTAVKWDADFGPELTSSSATLTTAFPFSGKTWTNLSVGMTGTVVFRESAE